MGLRYRRTARASIAGLVVTFALIGSAWLAFATTAPAGTGSYPGTTTTTSTVKTTTTTAPKTTTTVCKPGNGFGDKNHCHSGPPGQNKKNDDDKGKNKKGK